MPEDEYDRSRIRRSVSGDEQALERLLLKHAPALERYISGKLPPQFQNRFSADDILQEVFLRVFRKIDSCEATNDAEFYGWLRTIAQNQLVNHLTAQERKKRGGDRQQLRRPGDAQRSSFVDLVEILAGQDPTASRLVSRKEAVAAIQVGIAQLPDDQRKVIQLCFLEGRTTDEAAKAMGRTSGSVRGLVHRAKANLVDFLGRSSQWLSSA